MKNFSIIVAADEEMGIGRGNDLPWRLSADMKRFKEITTRPAVNTRPNVVIMGRRTWESLPEKFRPLPGRVNVVLSRNPFSSLPQGVLSFTSLEQCLDVVCCKKAMDFGDIFVIGGAQVFSESIANKCCSKLYVTVVSGGHACDVYFPAIPEMFTLKVKSPQQSEENEKFFFSEYERSI